MQGQLYTTRRQLADTRTELEQCKKKLDKYEAENDGDASRKMPRTEASSFGSYTKPSSRRVQQDQCYSEHPQRYESGHGREGDGDSRPEGDGEKLDEPSSRSGS